MGIGALVRNNSIRKYSVKGLVLLLLAATISSCAAKYTIGTPHENHPNFKRISKEYYAEKGHAYNIITNTSKYEAETAANKVAEKGSERWRIIYDAAYEKAIDNIVYHYNRPPYDDLLTEEEIEEPYNY